jgi:TRAP transporter TAXI family solute receptor
MKLFLRFGILFLLIVSFLIYLYNLIEPVPVKKISIATGRESGIYYKYALRYKKLLEAEGIAVTIVKTAGSLETLKLLNKKEVDIGFVQSGTASLEDKKHLNSIASLYFEPLWIFHRASLGKVIYLNELNGTRLSVGEKGSGTLALTEKLLAQTNLNNHVTLFNLDINSSYSYFKEGKLDTFFTVLSADSLLIQEILRDKELNLIELKRAKAFTEHFPFLQVHKIYEGGLDLKRDIPSEDVALLSTTATLITGKEVDKTLIRLVIKKIKESSPEGSIFPSPNYLEIPIHPASEKYLLYGDSFLEKIFPYWIASNIDRLKFLLIPLLTLLIPLFKSIVPLYRWRSRAKIYKWYRELDRISENWESFNTEELEKAQIELEALGREIRSKTDVPLSFKWEYHTLQHHIDNVIERMSLKRFQL